MARGESKRVGHRRCRFRALAAFVAVNVTAMGSVALTDHVVAQSPSSASPIYLPQLMKAWPLAPPEWVTQLGGSGKAIEPDGPLVFVGIGPRLVVYDRSEGAEPRELARSTVLSATVSAVASLGDFVLVVTADQGAQLFDLRALPALRPAHDFGLADRVLDADAYGDRLFLCTDRGLRIVHLQKTGQPTRVGQLNLRMGDTARCSVGSRGSLVVVTTNPSSPSRSEGTRHLAYVVDLGNPRLPALASTIEDLRAPNTGVSDVAIDPRDPRAFVLRHEATRGGSFIAWSIERLDLEDPSSPVDRGALRLGTTAGSAGTARLALFEDDLMVLLPEASDPTEDGIRRIDVADGSAMQERPPIAAVRPIEAFTARDGRLYIVGDRFQVWELRVGMAPSLQIDQELFGLVDALVMDDRAAYVLQHRRGQIRALSMGSSMEPREIGRYPFDRFSGSAALALLADHLVLKTDQLVILDRRDPARLQPVSTLTDLPVDIRSAAIAVESQVLYVAGREGIVSIDLSAPDLPRVRDRSALGLGQHLGVLALAVEDDMVFVLVDRTEFGDPRLALLAVDYGEPSARRLLGEIDIPGAYGAALRLRDGIAYVASGDTGLFSLDVSTPEAMSISGHVDLGGWTTGLALGDSILWVSNGAGWLHALDMTQSASPIELHRVALPGRPREVHLAGDRLWIASGEGGLLGLRP